VLNHACGARLSLMLTLVCAWPVMKGHGALQRSEAARPIRAYLVTVSHVRSLAPLRASYGRVTVDDAVLLDSHLIAVLDLRAQRLLLAAADSTGPAARITRARLSWDGERVGIADGAVGRMWSFRATARRLAQWESLATGFPFGDACWSNGLVAVVGLARDSAVHWLSPTTREVVSRGEPWGTSSSERLVLTTSQGVAACLGSVVVAASSLRPRLVGFAGPTGGAWQFTVPAFDTLRAVGDGRGAVSFPMPATGMHGILSVVRLEGDILAVQVARVGSSVQERLRTWLVDSRDGTTVGTQLDLPVIRSAMRGVALGVMPRTTDLRLTYFSSGR
jgi:hypothetical protein